MRFTSKLILTLSLVAMLAVTAEAQRPGGGRGGFPGGRGGFPGGGLGNLMGRFTRGSSFLLTNEAIQKELKMSDEQKEKLTKLTSEVGQQVAGKMRELFQGGGGFNREMIEKARKIAEQVQKETEGKAFKILNKDQIARLREIQLQQAGMNGLKEKRVQTALDVDEDQVEDINKILEDYNRERQALGRGGRGTDREERQKKIEALQTKTEKMLNRTLSKGQRAAWAKLKGKPFDLALLRTGFGGGRGGFGGGRGGFGTGGQVLSSFIAGRLNLTDEQKKKVEALQKEATEKLNKILTSEQQKQLADLRSNRGGNRPGTGGRGTFNVDSIIERRDTNKDGKISKEEAGTSWDRFYSRADENKDGFVTKAELEKAMQNFRRGGGGGGNRRPGGGRPGGGRPGGGN